MSYPSFRKALAKYLTADQMAEAIEYAWFESDQEPGSMALIGGAAMQVYGSDRLTRDVDLIYAGPEYPLPGKPLTFGGIAITSPAGVPIDLISRDDAYADLYEAALRHTLKVADLPVPVVGPTYLAAIKLVAGRSKNVEDLKHLIRTMTAAQRKATRRIIVQHVGQYAAEDFDSFVLEVELESPGGRRRKP